MTLGMPSSDVKNPIDKARFPSTRRRHQSSMFAVFTLRGAMSTVATVTVPTVTSSKWRRYLSACVQVGVASGVKPASGQEAGHAMAQL